jgi:hypothetical protein
MAGSTELGLFRRVRHCSAERPEDVAMVMMSTNLTTQESAQEQLKNRALNALNALYLKDRKSRNQK